jgi:hypothetical protein
MRSNIKPILNTFKVTDMKKIALLLCIFIGSFAVMPEAGASVISKTGMETGLIKGEPKINHKSAKRFKTHRGNYKRGKRTCLKKSGCAPKRSHLKSGRPCRFNQLP